MRYWQWLPLALLSMTLAACSESTVGVPVTGINYTDQEFEMYAVREPGNAERNRGGGEPLGPYSAGGIMCCYALPKEWHEGLQVELVIRHALRGETYEERSQDLLERRESGTLNDYIVVDVPPYDNIEHSGLWVQLLPDDRYAVVVSDVDPRHEDWPGEVKGWPRPSDEYRKKLAEQRLPGKILDLEMFSRSLEKAKDGDFEVLERYWNIIGRNDPEEITQYSGPQDEAFQERVVTLLESWVEKHKEDVERLKGIAR